MHRVFGLLVSTLVATSILVGGAVPSAAAFETDANRLAEPESICAAAHEDACALATSSPARRLPVSGLAVAASRPEPTRVARALRAYEEVRAGPSGRSLARWCVAHSTSTSLF